MELEDIDLLDPDEFRRAQQEGTALVARLWREGQISRSEQSRYVVVSCEKRTYGKFAIGRTRAAALQAFQANVGTVLSWIAAIPR